MSTPQFELIETLRDNNRLLREQNDFLRGESEARQNRLLQLEEKLSSLYDLLATQGREILRLKLALFGADDSD